MSILCTFGIHKYIDDTRPILTTDGKTLKVDKLEVCWCERCHKCRDYDKEYARTILELAVATSIRLINSPPLMMSSEVTSNKD